MEIKTRINQLLAEYNYDVVSGIHESLVNSISQRYFEAHKETNLFRGTQDVESLDLKVYHEFTEAPLFDFTPLDLPDAKGVVSASVKNIKGIFSDLTGGNILAELLMNTAVRGKIIYSTNLLQFQTENVDIEIYHRSFSNNKHNGCNLDELIEHVLESFLKVQISTSLSSIPIPNPPEFITGFKTSIAYIDFEQNNLLVGLNVIDDKYEDFSNAILGTELFSSLYENEPKLSVQYTRVGENDIAEGTIDFSKVRPSTENLIETKVDDFNETSLPEGDFNMFVAFANKAFQRIADLQFNRRMEKSDSHNGDGGYWWYRYGVQTSNSSTSLISKGIRVVSGVALWAEAEAGKHFLWPIGWIRVGLRGDGSQTVGMNANLFTKNQDREIWLNPAIDQIGNINIRFTFRPRLIQWLIGWLVDFILRGLYVVVLNILAIVSLFLKIKLFTLPESLPISQIKIRPENIVFGNWDDKLFTGVKIGFVEEIGEKNIKGIELERVKVLIEG